MRSNLAVALNHPPPPLSSSPPPLIPQPLFNSTPAPLQLHPKSAPTPLQLLQHFNSTPTLLQPQLHSTPTPLNSTTPPCSSDPRDLSQQVMDYATTRRVQWCYVAALAKHKKRRVTFIMTTFKKLKYQVKAFVLDSRGFGLSQRRRRCYIIAALPPKSSSNAGRISLKRPGQEAQPGARLNIKAALRRLRKDGVDPTKQECCVDIAACVKFLV